MTGPKSNRHPIVLACGIARSDELREQLASLLEPAGIVLPDSRHYFRGVRSRLMGAGYDAHHTHVSFAADVATRSRELAGQMRAILADAGAEKAHLVTHSMGGLDARHMIVNDSEMSARVASLTTIGTPHRGSEVADHLLEHGFGEWVEKINPFLRIDGVHDLATEACAAFNRDAEATEAANPVRYSTWSSVSDEPAFFLAKPGRVIVQRAGPNDGLVALASQEWTAELRGEGVVKPVRRFRFPFSADHLNQLGWWAPSDMDSALKSLSVWSRWRSEDLACEKRVGELYLAIAETVCRADES